jgi:hypothetical protein
MNYKRHGDRILLLIDERSAESFTRWRDRAFWREAIDEEVGMRSPFFL